MRPVVEGEQTSNMELFQAVKACEPADGELILSYKKRLRQHLQVKKICGDKFIRIVRLVHRCTVEKSENTSLNKFVYSKLDDIVDQPKQPKPKQPKQPIIIGPIEASLGSVAGFVQNVKPHDGEQVKEYKLRFQAEALKAGFNQERVKNFTRKKNIAQIAAAYHSIKVTNINMKKVNFNWNDAKFSYN
jgi:hypothetical protein